MRRKTSRNFAKKIKNLRRFIGKQIKPPENSMYISVINKKNIMFPDNFRKIKFLFGKFQ